MMEQKIIKWKKGKEEDRTDTVGILNDAALDNFTYSLLPFAREVTF